MRAIVLGCLLGACGESFDLPDGGRQGFCGPTITCQDACGTYPPTCILGVNLCPSRPECTGASGGSPGGMSGGSAGAVSGGSAGAVSGGWAGVGSFTCGGSAGPGGGTAVGGGEPGGGPGGGGPGGGSASGEWVTGVDGSECWKPDPHYHLDCINPCGGISEGICANSAWICPATCADAGR